ncbi:Shedu anti-phage system protein SduA domain-containing protein [Cellvibrio sp. ARAG 10.3]|uniref:Shedu anti-phage system protein SduA domain-containing protein n=1 Tax=Cellvibrio sp. ARAG 10.3 TaxID=3451358 RepID=UPI003F46CD69
MKTGHLPPDTSLEEVKLKIKQTTSNPNVGQITQVDLKDGPRAFRIATLTEVLNPKTKDFHHYSLRIDHIDKTKSGWFAKPDKSTRLEGDSPDEIKRLYEFLHAILSGELKGAKSDLRVIRDEDYIKLENILNSLPNIIDSDKLNLAGTLLSKLDVGSSDFSNFVTALESSPEETLRHIGSASRYIEYKKALEELAILIADESTPEAAFQNLLSKHPWMFGSEYSELLSRRSWTRDDNLDYMLRRTVDNFLEIIEIKTALREPLFRYDNSHDSYYPSSKLSTVIGQVIRYIEEVERNRDQIIVKDNEDTLKIRARVIVGRDVDEKHQKALRSLNGHLNRIEVITFDQLYRIADRVLTVFLCQKPLVESDVDEIPF